MAPLLGNRRCYGNHFAPYSLGVVLMLGPEYEVDVTTRIMELQHILPEYIMYPYDLDL